MPEERRLDLAVQIATNTRGAVAFIRILDQNGHTRVERAIDNIIAYTARRLQLRLELIEGARGSFTTWLDDDGFDGDMVPITATISVNGGRLLIDFAGTGKQARGGLNAPESAVRATAFYCVKALLDPGLLPNGGLFDAVDLSLAPGSIVSPIAPAAVGARSLTCQKVAGAIFGAFRDILPEDRVMASSNDVLPSILFSGRRPDGRVYVCGETLGGGSGALSDLDGMDAVHVHCTNTMNLPVEALEHEFPLLVDEYALASGSGGAGRQRGGMGVTRTYRTLAESTVLNCRSDSHKRGAAGVHGGGEGGCASLWRNYGTPDATNLGGRIAGLNLSAGETIRIQTAGGGGFGEG